MLLSAAFFRARPSHEATRRDDATKAREHVSHFPHFASFISNCDEPKWSFKLKSDIVTGDADAIYQRARFYLIKKNDLDTAMNYYEQAAELSHAQAQVELGNIYSSFGHFQNALKYYKMAADQDYSGGQYNLGACYQNGNGVLRDLDEAMRLYHLAADQNYPDALYALAINIQLPEGTDMQGPEAKLFLDYMIRSADLGYSVAQYVLGNIYLEGVKVPKDLQKAERYYKLSADQGFLQALVTLAVHYSTGVLGKERTEQMAQALHYYKLAADRGHRWSAYMSGMIYFENRNKKREALRYFRFAAENGELSAQTMIGYFQIFGFAMDKNVQEGLRTMQECAEKECIVAYQLLADLYSAGAPGVPPSAELAQKYITLLGGTYKPGRITSPVKESPDFWNLYEWQPSPWWQRWW